MSQKSENTGFICENCGNNVYPLTNGSFRNHCPFCLCSKHVDIDPGDRKNICGGVMLPIGIKYRSGKGYQILHRCEKCGQTSLNKSAENTEQPDNFEILTKLPMN